MFLSRLCFATPAAGGRILETGVEELLKLKQDGSLGKGTCAPRLSSHMETNSLLLSIAPIIVVLTKYDELVDREDRLLDDTGLNEDEISRQVDENARAALRRDCILPLEKAIGTQVLYTAVSSRIPPAQNVFRSADSTITSP